MGKYDPLWAFLGSQTQSQLKLSFSEIERILNARLPASARGYPAWWANERVTTHQHARAWLDAGYETRRLDLNAATVEFVRSPTATFPSQK